MASTERRQGRRALWIVGGCIVGWLIVSLPVAALIGATAAILDMGNPVFDPVGRAILSGVMLVFVVVGGFVGNRLGRNRIAGGDSSRESARNESRPDRRGGHIALWAVAGVVLIVLGAGLALYSYYWMNMEYDAAIQAYRPDRSNEEDRIPGIAAGGVMILAGLFALLIASVAMGTRIGSQRK